jgi:SAM-dependent methyltransferase
VLAESGFVHDQDNDLWIPSTQVNVDYADGSEAYLQGVFRDADVITDYPVELAGSIHDWASRYHLSHLRVNLLDAIGDLLDESWTALELGAGPGALTKWLAQRVARVDAFEGSLDRARANRLRTRGDENVRVLVGDIAHTPFPDVYDLVTLVGVLEYMPLASNMSRDEACLAALRKVHASLKENGTLVLALENQLGLKYWAGCREDHTGCLFDGLIGYPNRSAITYSRNRLESLLREAGFDYLQFYHVFPDYKLPTTVIRECDEVLSLSPHEWVRDFAEDYGQPRFNLLPDPVVLRTMRDAGLFFHFSNSFMVLCSKSPLANLKTDWCIRKYWTYSRPELHHRISLVDREGARVVERRPYQHGQERVVLDEYVFEPIDSVHVPGTLVMYDVYDALLSDDWRSALSVIAVKVLDESVSRFSTHVKGESGCEMLDGASLDFTFWNLMRTSEDSLEVIDCKWTKTAPIPADYVMFRGLWGALRTFAPYVRGDIIDAIREIIQQRFPGCDDERLLSFYGEEMRFQALVMGTEYVAPDELPKIPYGGGMMRDK